MASSSATAATSSAAAAGASLPALCAAWAGAVAARAGTALVGGAPVLQDATLTGLNPMLGFDGNVRVAKIKFSRPVLDDRA